MTNREQDRDPSKQGFAGLSSMASDVDDVISRAKANARPLPSGVEENQERQSSGAPPGRTDEHRQGATASPSSGSRRWLIGVGAIAVLAWLISLGDENTTGSLSSNPPAPSALAPSSLDNGSAPPADPITGYVDRAGSSGRPSGPTTMRFSEEKPPAGTNHTHTTAQIRYCLAEDIRIDAADPLVNSYVEADIDRFNAMVEDYNSRCSEFYYYEATLEAAQAQVEPYRAELEEEGRSRFAPATAATGLAAPARAQLESRGAAVKRATLTPSRATLGVTPGRSLPGLSEPSRTESSPPDKSGGKPDLSGVSRFEREAVERACNYDRQYSGPATYYACISRELRNLAAYNGKPDLSEATPSERAAIERSCNYDQQYSGPGAYYGCLARELRSLSSYNGKPDISGTSSWEQQAIETTCNYDRQYSGPGAYYSCLSREISGLRLHNGKPDLSVVSASERQAVERACNYDRQYSGPAAYYSCLKRELQELGT